MHSTPTDTASSQPPTLRLWQWLAIVALLAWYYVSALTAVSGKSATADEAYHLASGYSYWLFGDFRMQPENGNLPQRWAALPLLLGDYEFPSLDQDSWRYSQMDVFGNQFIYAPGNENVLMLGRAMIGLLGVALGGLVFAWSRRLLSTSAAFVTLTLFVFCPTVLNNGTWITSDMAATLFFMASIGALWIVMRQVNWRTVLASTLLMGLLFVAKFSAVLIVPMGLVLMGVQILSNQPLEVRWGDRVRYVASRAGRLGVMGALILAHAVVVWCVIWTFYNFRYGAFGVTEIAQDERGQTVVVDRLHNPWEDMLKPERGLIDKGVFAAREWRLLPEAYLFGFIHSYNFAQQRRAFLNGEISLTGFRTFFPYSLSVKTPLTLFMLVLLGGLALWNSWHEPRDGNAADARARMWAGIYRSAPLWSLFAVYWVFAITSHLNIGHRHILPTYPPMIMLAGASALWLARAPRTFSAESRAGRWQYPALATLVLGGVLLFAGESLWAWPNYLAYFNQLIGGPRYAYRHLVDGSLDWGQEMPALKRWLVERGLDNSPGKKVYLSYFGHASPYYFDIEFEDLPGIPGFTPPHLPQPWDAGTYCISATMLQSIYTPFTGKWRAEYEQVYQEMRAKLREYLDAANDSEARQQWVESVGGPGKVQRWFADFERARFGRLCAYLRQREPDEEINYAILVYRLSKDDVRQALFGPPAELVETTKQAP